VLAHPFWDLDDPAEVESLIEAIRPDGVECFYPTHNRDQTAFLVRLCRERGLLRTGSSDYDLVGVARVAQQHRDLQRVKYERRPVRGTPLTLVCGRSAFQRPLCNGQALHERGDPGAAVR
jgi:hypothetical protein